MDLAALLEYLVQPLLISWCELQALTILDMIHCLSLDFQLQPMLLHHSRNKFVNFYLEKRQKRKFIFSHSIKRKEITQTITFL